MRFRQVHLDFHTSECIEGIGAAFDRKQFQEALKTGHVDSITVFSKCHHGWAYHPSDANEQHPHLDFDLLGEMIDAAHEIDVKTPVYLSAGLDEKLAVQRPEWLLRSEQDNTEWVPDFMTPGYHVFCLNTPYLDILLRQLEEVLQRYDADGIFLDIVGVRPCYCHTCMNELRRRGQDPRDKAAVLALAEEVYANYTRRVRETIDKYKPGLPVFHNGGHICRGRRDLAFMDTHLELESLPTGGWGYDHFPLSARYVQQLGLEFLGMTGKFHTTWGEFGGYKHPNALRYEAALSIANGAKCSIGDQMHPSGRMDPATYALIGAAYSEVEQKQAWCDGVESVADVGLLSLESVAQEYADHGAGTQAGACDAGAVRMLLEGKYLFDVLDLQSDFSRYKVLVLPDGVLVDETLKAKLDAYVTEGGKLLATGRSGLGLDGSGFAVDLGIIWKQTNSFRPSYFRPQFRPGALEPSAFIMYAQGQVVELAGAELLGGCENSYFNRDALHFCSHQHTPCTNQYASPGMTQNENGIYIAWEIFEDYATSGSLICKEMFKFAMDRLLGTQKTLATSLPAQGVVTLMEQKGESRYVNHLLYASPVRRGQATEVIEDILPLTDVAVQLRTPKPVKRAYLAPQMTELPIEHIEGGVRYTVPCVECHQMVVLDY